MSQIDKTKKSIGINKIEEKDRQEIFKKFVDAGGQVIKEDSSKKEDPKAVKSGKAPISRAPIARDRKTKVQGNDPRNSKNNNSESSKNDVSDNVDSKIHENNYSSFLSIFFLKFKSWSSKVSEFSSPVLTPDFLSQLNLELKESLLNFNLAAKEILGNPDIYQNMVVELSKESPFYPELIIRGGKIMDYGELEELFRDYNLAPQKGINVSSVYNPLYSIFRKIYFIYPYNMSYMKALEKGFDILEKYEKKSSVIYKTRKKQLSKYHNFIFDKAFEKIYLAVLRHNNKNIPLESKYMEVLLDIKNEERIGSLKNFNFVEIEPKAEEPIIETDNKEEDTENEKDEEIPEIVKHGLDLMGATNLENLRKKYDPKKEFSDINISDKAFVSYIFFQEFDVEYSLVLTTKKVVVNSINEKGVKIDYREKLGSIYELNRNCIEQFRLYVETTREYEKVKSTPLANYIEQSKKMTQMDQKKNIQSRSTRVSIKEYIEKTAVILNTFLEDMEKEKAIIGNPDEILSFDNVESKKKLNKKKIREAIYDCCAFCNGLLSKLGDSGELYGAGLELTAEQLKNSYGIEVLVTTSDSAESPKDDSGLSDI
jgi:hypothetical protein